MAKKTAKQIMEQMKKNNSFKKSAKRYDAMTKAEKDSAVKRYAKYEAEAAMKNFRKQTVTNPSHQKDLARMSGATAARAASKKQQQRYAKGKPMKLSKIGAAGARAERRTLRSFK